MIRAGRTEAPAPDLAFEKGAFRLGPGAALLRGAWPNCEEVFRNTPQQAEHPPRHLQHKETDPICRIDAATVA